MAEEKKVTVDEMMAIYKKVGTPGAPHMMLAGNWTTKTRAYMEPDKPPVEGEGTCEQKMILDGRYLQQEYKGEMMGDTFYGLNIIGYDNHTKKYVSTWIDSMSTSIYCFEGTGSEDGKTIKQECSYDDPARGPMTWRSVSRMVNDNFIQYEMYLIPRGGQEEKMMEMAMTREE